MAPQGALAGGCALAFGLALGSFIGLVWDRVPAGEPVVHGRSRCGFCGRVLDPLDLVPVFGFLLRRGRCAGCGVSIPRRYPVIEAGAAVVMLAAVGWGGMWAGGAAGVAALLVFTGAGLAVALRRQ